MKDTSTICWPAPAKLNLFLHINGRRPDGYHELQTLFIFLDHGDQLRFACNLSDTITITPALADVPVEQNLIYRAAMLLNLINSSQISSLIVITSYSIHYTKLYELIHE